MKRMVAAGVLVIGGYGLGVLAGCSAESGRARPVSYDELPGTMAATLCSGLETCCTSAGFAFDRSACENQGSRNLQQSLPRREATVYDSSAAGDCVESLRAYYSSCGSGEPDVSRCEETFKGTLPAGSACEGSEECARPESGDVHCEYQGEDEAMGACVLAPAAERGMRDGPCSSTCQADGCDGVGGGSATEAACYRADGLYCDYTSNTCQPIQRAGGACDDSSGCDEGLYCDTTLDTCTAKKPDGATCLEWDECIHRCDTQGGDVPGTCVPRFQVDAEICAAGMFEVD